MHERSPFPPLTRDPPPMPKVRPPRDPDVELRDMFAAYAMQEFLAYDLRNEPGYSPNRIANGAYGIADAMLERRKQ